MVSWATVHKAGLKIPIPAAKSLYRSIFVDDNI
jgi:hypothetical protein